jgi:hypothetical protein
MTVDLQGRERPPVAALHPKRLSRREIPVIVSGDGCI